VETLKEFRNILLGHQVVVHTDHKNLTCKNFNTERVMRWRLILEEFGPDLHYIKGERNIVADALSRLGMVKDPITESMPVQQVSELYAVDENEALFPKDYPLSYAEIRHRQERDIALQEAITAPNSPYRTQTFYMGKDNKGAPVEFELITKDNRIVLPRALREKAMEWYHTTLIHPGISRTYATMAQHYTWTGMKAAVERFCKRCPTCQLYKNKKENYGHLPPKEAEVLPWEQVCIDLVGPYTIGNKANSDERTLHCLTMIDPATGWFEIEQIPSKRADEVMSVFENTWLGRYPRPIQVVMDRGTEFQAEVANSLVNDYGITRKLITTRNPQANAMVERAHQTIHNMVAILNLQDKNHEDPYHSWNGLLNAVRFAMKATVCWKTV